MEVVTVQDCSEFKSKKQLSICDLPKKFSVMIKKVPPAKTFAEDVNKLSYKKEEVFGDKFGDESAFINLLNRFIKKKEEKEKKEIHENVVPVAEFSPSI